MSNAFPPQQYRAAIDKPPKKSNKSLVIIAAVLGVAGLCVLLCCGGGIGAVMFGLNVVTAEVKDIVRDHPVIQENIGEIETFEMDFSASVANQDEDAFVYEVVGSKGSGELTATAVTDDGGVEQMVSASLRTSDGRIIELDFE